MGDRKPAASRIAFGIALCLTAQGATALSAAASGPAEPVAAPAAKLTKLPKAHRIGLNRKLAAMNRVFAIEPQALNRFPDTFGGLWETKQGKLKLAFTAKPDATVDKLKTSLPDKKFDGVLVDDSLAYLHDLEADAAELRTSPGPVQVPYDLDVDVKANNVVVTHDPSLSQVQYDAHKAAIQAHVGTRAEDLVFRRAEVAEPQACGITKCGDLQAGLKTTSDTAVNCTTAFVVTPIPGMLLGSRAILSAAHCGDPDADVGVGRSHGGTAYGDVNAEQQSGAVDAEVHEIDNDDFGTANSILMNRKTPIGSPFLPVVAVSKFSALPIGRLVCRTGITTRVQCGPVTSKSASPSYIPGSHSFVRAEMCNEKGDSGGPVYIPFSYKPAFSQTAVHVAMAVGILSGGTNKFDCPSTEDYSIFSHITHVKQALGVKVLTPAGQL